MKFTHGFHIPVDPATAFATLTDLERVAPCMPGASLDGVEGNLYSGRIKVKVGPVSIQYKGTAQLTETVEDPPSITLRAEGKEMKNSGTASADVVARLSEDAEGTMVHVETEIDVTGNAALIGRAVLPEISARIIDEFAQRLKKMLVSDHVAGAEGAATPNQVPQAHGAQERTDEDAKRPPNENAVKLSFLLRPLLNKFAVPAIIVGLVILAFAILN